MSISIFIATAAMAMSSAAEDERVANCAAAEGNDEAFCTCMITAIDEDSDLQEEIAAGGNKPPSEWDTPPSEKWLSTEEACRS